jgi:glycine/D-amino acid oxidase-like deaminating enzyme
VTKPGLEIVVIGSGIFGASSALELAQRGHQVTLIDPGPVPRPVASSTDISKAVRMDYGSDDLYMTLMEVALLRWDKWNLQWGEKLYHQDGFLFLTSNEMRAGDFEYESFQLLKQRGHHAERMNPEALKARYPAWNAQKYQDGYYNPRAGWAESGRVVERLVHDAQAAGVLLRSGLSLKQLMETGSRISGVVSDQSESIHADYVVLAAGPWSPSLLPQLAEFMRPIAQPIFYFRPDNVADYLPERFPVWGADMSKTGWYGFPATPDGIVKVSNHGPGREVLPDAPRQTTPEAEGLCRAFLASTFPGLAGAPLVSSRTCLYCDAWDGNFYIDHVPDRPGLVVATGGSGHGFKFAPVLGGLVADVVERKPNIYSARFAWRQRGHEPVKEQARHR